MPYVIGAMIVSLLFLIVGIVLIAYYFKNKINDDVLALHDNFILTTVIEHKKAVGKYKAPKTYNRKKVLFQYCVFSLISLISMIYFTVMFFTSFINP